jgi:hypothetical protein
MCAPIDNGSPEIWTPFQSAISRRLKSILTDAGLKQRSLTYGKTMKNCFFSGILMLVTANALACKVDVLPLEQQVERADEIFIANLLEAKVMRIDDLHKWPWIEGRFQVMKTLKGGKQPKEILLTTGLGRGDCGIGMMVSWNYVIFNGRNDTSIGYPSGTHIIEDFQVEELAKKIQSIVRQQQNKPRQK